MWWILGLVVAVVATRYVMSQGVHDTAGETVVESVVEKPKTTKKSGKAKSKSKTFKRSMEGQKDTQSVETAASVESNNARLEDETTKEQDNGEDREEDNEVDLGAKSKFGILENVDEQGKLQQPAARVLKIVPKQSAPVVQKRVYQKPREEEETKTQRQNRRKREKMKEEKMARDAEQEQRRKQHMRQLEQAKMNAAPKKAVWSTEQGSGSVWD
ncbi:hypothetical protein EDD86DRAFT_217441 [Gorgonomyces haynaldii]|nr:hypothetical protein EDD86DRAFT_217441 [Gorgonomyces haynaldii]